MERIDHPLSALGSGRMGVALAVLASMAGCSSLDAGPQYWRESRSVDTSGAYQLTDRGVVEPIDIGYLLLRYAPRSLGSERECAAAASATPAFAAGGIRGTESEGGEQSDRVRLDKSVLYFNCRAEQASEDQRRAARNALQERLLMASAQRCNAFKTGLQRSFSRTNFGLGVLTTIAATAGALVSAPAAAKNWAGGAAVASGARAEYNQDFFANLAAHVIIDGVDKRRQDVYDQIQRLGQARAYADYPVEAAIKDALFYHGQCTVAAGFQQASDAIRFSADPGMNSAIQTMARLKAANSLMNASGLSDEEILKRSAALSSASPVIAGSVLSGGDAALPLAQMRNVVASIDVAAQALRNAVAQFKARRPEGGPSAADLGLDPEPKVNSLADDLKVACFGTLTRYASDEQVQLAAAKAESDPAKSSNLSGDAAKSARLAGLLVEAASQLATPFRAAADKAQAEWEVQFVKATKDKDAAAQQKLKAALGSPPKLDEDRLKTLTSLCGPTS